MHIYNNYRGDLYFSKVRSDKHEDDYSYLGYYNNREDFMKYFTDTYNESYLEECWKEMEVAMNSAI